jgi:murein DD-endopeptidase MepM/ murein hydrolase activator NlpD
LWLEGVLAVGVTLAAVTAAYATGTMLTLPAPAPAAAPALVEPVEPVAQVEEPPPPAFECGEPVPGHSVNSPFGLRRMPWERHGRLHEGVDISAPVGKPVVAAADGVITRAGKSSTYGRFVEIKHGAGLVTFYAHLGRIERKARPGTAVLAGMPVGRIGSSGTSTGPHLHFEIRQNDRPLNPTAFIGREFAKAEDLPLKSAARYSSRVRVAQVSFIPEEKRALMGGARKTKEGRVRATLLIVPAAVDKPAETMNLPIVVGGG